MLTHTHTERKQTFVMEGAGASTAGGTRAFSGLKEDAMDESEAELVRVDSGRRLLL